MYKQFILVTLMISTTCAVAFGGEKSELDWRRSSITAWRAQNHNSSYSVYKDNAVASSSVPGLKSVPKAVLFSAAIPGTGQFYYGSIWKGLLFMAIETAAWITYFNADDSGNKKEAEFEGYADQNWVEPDYWQWLSERSGLPLEDDAGLREYEHSTFSHSLPRIKNQQYYENIGKYNQFNIGWIDTESGGARDSDFREIYTFMRKDANDDFKKASTMLTIILFNHTISAFEAGFTTSRRNKRAVQASVRMNGFIEGNRVIPALTLGVRW